jgi:hypothetical protein
LNKAKKIMDGDTRFALLVIGLPFLGLIYCAGIIIFMNVSTFAQQHPLFTGLGFAIVPFALAAYFWIRASAKAYKKK